MLHGLHIHFALGQLLLFDSVVRLCRVGFPRGGSTGKDHANGLRAVSLLNRSHLQTAFSNSPMARGMKTEMESCCSLSFSLRHIQFDCLTPPHCASCDIMCIMIFQTHVTVLGMYF